MSQEDNDTHCEIHHEAMLEGNVFIRYGLIRYSDEFYDAHNQFFPNSRFVAWGGCMLQDTLLAIIRYCPSCRTSHIKWCEEHHCSDGLAPNEHEVERLLQLYWGKPASIEVMPEHIDELLAQGKVVKAILALKKAYPAIEIPDLRAYVHYMRKRKELDLLRPALQSPARRT